MTERTHATSAEPGFANVAGAISAAQMARPRIDVARLTAFIAAQPDVRGPVQVSAFRYVESGGSSNGIALFRVDFADAPERGPLDLVLRYAPGEQLLKQKRFDDEFFTLAALQQHDIPAPRPLWMDPTPVTLGYPFLIMTAIQGRAPSPHMMYASGVLAEATPAERKQMLLEAATFHGRLRRAAIGTESVPHLVRRGGGQTAIERELSWWLNEARLAMIDGDSRLTYLTDLYRWMVEHQPAARAATLVHGDAQIANLMFDGCQLVAALDWELSYLGHNEADLALVVYLLQAHMADGTVAGVPSEAEVIAHYEAACGAPVEHWAYFRLFNLVKVSTIMCMSARNMDAEAAQVLWQVNAADRETAWAQARAEARA